MLIVSPITPHAVPYYFTGREEGQWLGGGAEQLGLEGVVDRRDLLRVLRGCDPRTGRYLPAVKPARRRAGWDLILAAPKSVSLLGALAGEEAATAHRDAVLGAVGHIERELLWVRRNSAPRGKEPATGAVCAAFAHTMNAAGEPHIHTHLVLANLAMSLDGAWCATRPDLWVARRSLSAVYQMGLRHHLAAQGIDVDWRLHDDGLADVAGVPRAAIRATSSRSNAIAAASEQERDKAPAVVAAARTRNPSAPTRDWAAQAAGAGFDRHGATALLRQGPNAITPALEDAVGRWLLRQRSSFRECDVIRALAACSPSGGDARWVVEWAKAFCAGSIPIPAPPGAAARYTTTLAAEADRRVEDHLARFAGGAGVTVLAAAPGRCNLLAHASLIESAAAGWHDQGATVAIATTSRSAEMRWLALTGIEPRRRSGRADVVIVDQVDRRSPPELLGLLAGLEGSDVLPVLVEGGTSPRLSWVRSDGFSRFADRFGRTDPPAPRLWEPSPRGDPTTAAAVVASLLRAWREAWDARSPATLVGLGVPEVDGLNQAAREILVNEGAIGGPALTHRGRTFQAGDRLLPLKAIAEQVPRGKPLEVAEVDPRRSTLTVRSGGRDVTLERTALRSVGYAYAVTPGLAGRTEGPLVVLGPAEELGRHRPRVVQAQMVEPVRELGLERREGLSVG